MEENKEFTHTGTNFVVISLIGLVVLCLLGWGIIQWREMRHTDETAVPGVMVATPSSLQEVPATNQPAHTTDSSEQSR